jgi:hypothetical protein
MRRSPLDDASMARGAEVTLIGAFGQRFGSTNRAARLHAQSQHGVPRLWSRARRCAGRDDPSDVAARQRALEKTWKNITQQKKIFV